MPKRLGFPLSEAQRHELLHLRWRGEPAYLRERAAAVLLLADGVSACEVAAHRLLQPRNEETVCSWYWRYRRHGVVGLSIRAGRGRKPAFSPSALRRRGRPRRAVALGTPRSAKTGRLAHSALRWLSCAAVCRASGSRPMSGCIGCSSGCTSPTSAHAATSIALTRSTRRNSLVRSASGSVRPYSADRRCSGTG